MDKEELEELANSIKDKIPPLHLVETLAQFQNEVVEVVSFPEKNIEYYEKWIIPSKEFMQAILDSKIKLIEDVEIDYSYWLIHIRSKIPIGVTVISLESYLRLKEYLPDPDLI
jgi:hypothetical protein